MQLLDSAGRFHDPAAGRTRHWVEHLRSADLSVGTYSVPVDGADDQVPHTEDEVYVVMTGRAVLRSGEQSLPVGPSSVVFVPAGEPHRFVDVTEPLTVLVIFAPAEGSRAPAES